MKRVAAKIAVFFAFISAKLNRVCWTAGIILLLVMLGTVALQVVARYIFFSPPAWTEELARYAMVWAGFLGATVSFYKNADPVLATDEKRAPGTQFVYLLLRSAAVALFLIPIIYWSPVIISHHMLRETESLKLISGYVYLVIPIFSIVILVHVVARLLSAATGQGEYTVKDVS